MTTMPDPDPYNDGLVATFCRQRDLIMHGKDKADLTFVAWQNQEMLDRLGNICDELRELRSVMRAIGVACGSARSS